MVFIISFINFNLEHMKKCHLILVVFLSVFAVNAQQTVSDEVAYLQNLYGKSKYDLINDYLKLSAEQKTAFDKVYADYEEKREELSREKLQLIKSYAEHYNELTEEKVNDIAKATLKNNMALEKLYCKTYSKAKSAVGAANAAKFIQIEEYLHTQIRKNVQEAIPLVGELKRS